MKNLVVILDNGHGENTKGKCSPDKRLLEWEWTREIACRLHNLLLENEIEVQLLVPEDKDISLSERVKREKKITKEAKKVGKETCLISIHMSVNNIYLIIKFMLYIVNIIFCMSLKLCACFFL